MFPRISWWLPFTWAKRSVHVSLASGKQGRSDGTYKLALESPFAQTSLILPKNSVKRRFEETESVCPFGTLFLPGIISVLCKCTVQNGSGSLFRNVRRCSWRRRFGVLFLFCLVSFDIPSKPTTPQIFLISPSEAVFSHIWMFVCRTLSPPIK